MVKSKLIIAAAAVVLVAPVVAQAHVTVQPEQVPAGGFTRLDVRVPNERDDAATEKVEVQLPDGFLFVSYEPVPGWDVEVAFERLDQPIEEHGDRITEQVRRVTWTATDESAAIQPGQFRDFGLSVGMPEGAEGDTLTFPALQTYDSGEVVRWIGPPDSEEPAAQVSLTSSPETEAAHEADESAEGSQGTEEAESTEADDGTGSSTEDDDDDAPMGLAVAGLIVGGLGLLAGGASLLRGRRS
jgi:periplasmic copper chaperone A